ncbi:hypothetical protein [Sulfolobus tengchongensis]|uniref:hypothetical protein n=1 Tax=Sulfolobus tengchongensis TaxID=207809 RepID=UPI0030D4C651
MNSPLIEKVFICKENIFIKPYKAVRAGRADEGWDCLLRGNLCYTFMRIVFFPEKQEILIAKWGCFVRKARVVHSQISPIFRDVK